MNKAAFQQGYSQRCHELGFHKLAAISPWWGALGGAGLGALLGGALSPQGYGLGGALLGGLGGGLGGYYGMPYLSPHLEDLYHKWFQHKPVTPKTLALRKAEEDIERKSGWVRPSAIPQ